jgi:hypothetical protein
VEVSILSSLIPVEVPVATQLTARLSGEQRAAMLEALLSHQVGLYKRAEHKLNPVDP